MQYTTNEIKSIYLNRDHFLLNWHVTGWCNYHCPYCINSQFSGEYIPESKVIDLAKHLNKFINEQIPLNTKVQIRLIGGEPSFYDWPKILDNITRIDKLSITTNFSKDNTFFKELYTYCHNRNIMLFVATSFHPEHQNFYSKMLDMLNWINERNSEGWKLKAPTITMLVNNNFNKQSFLELIDGGITNIRLNLERDMHHNHVSINDDLVKFANDWNIKCSDQVIKKSGKKKVVATTLDGTETDFINTNSLRGLFKDGFAPDNFYCTAGITSMVCMSNGDAVLAKCEFLKNTVIGNFYSDDVIIPKNNVICKLASTMPDCKCSLDCDTNMWRVE